MWDVSMLLTFWVLFFKQKTAYEVRSSDWSSDVCSSDLRRAVERLLRRVLEDRRGTGERGAQGAGLPPELRGPVRPQVVMGMTASHDARSVAAQIGRASCRERVCQYV